MNISPNSSVFFVRNPFNHRGSLCNPIYLLLDSLIGNKIVVRKVCFIIHHLLIKINLIHLIVMVNERIKHDIIPSLLQRLINSTEVNDSYSI